MDKLVPEHYYTTNPLSDLKLFTINPRIRNYTYRFDTCSGVFSFKKVDKGTKLLLKLVQIPPTAARILDMGTGYGIVGIVVAKEFPQTFVTMIDINQRAVWIARKNLNFNHISNAKVYWGDFYAPIKNELKSYDVILSNPPLALGHEPIIQFILESPKYLKQNGYFYLVIRTRQGAKKLSQLMNSIFQNVELVGIQSGYRVFRSQQR
ncbi:MAG: class I SAM-dependent methyltransferase [Candidatus Helarchaeota archaeon]